MVAFPTNRTNLKAVSFECSVGRQVLRAWGEHHEQMRNGRERFRHGDLFGQYISANNGGRRISFSSGEEWTEVSRLNLEEEKAMIAAGEVTVSPLPSTPLDW